MKTGNINATLHKIAGLGGIPPSPLYIRFQGYILLLAHKNIASIPGIKITSAAYIQQPFHRMIYGALVITKKDCK